MRLVFAGTPDFAATVLRTLVQRGHELMLVLTQPDAKSGRGLQQIYSPVKKVAEGIGIAVQQPSSLKADEVAQALARCPAEAWVVAAYGLILPPRILQIPPRGCINVHASLLPRWRGAAPIQRAIMAGDTETGVCIMRMEAGLDTGPIYLCRRTPIAPGETAGSLHDRLAQLGAEAVCDVLDRIAHEDLMPAAQSCEGVTYAHKIGRDDARVAWQRPAAEIERLLRALDPVPGAFTEYADGTLKLWRGVVRPATSDVPPGTVVDAGPAGLEVRCLDADLLVTELQRPGGRRLPAEAFLRGARIPLGSRLGS